MLRTQPLDVYQKWTTNEVKFTDPAVVAAINEFGKIAKNEKYVSGGVAAVASTDFRDSPKGLFDIPPKCYLHHQASFVPPSSRRVPRWGRTLISSTCRHTPPSLSSASRFWARAHACHHHQGIARRKGVRQLPADTDRHEVWMAQSSFLTPYKGVNVETYANEQMKRQGGEILTTATTFGFDGFRPDAGQDRRRCILDRHDRFRRRQIRRSGRGRYPEGLGRPEITPDETRPVVRRRASSA